MVSRQYIFGKVYKSILDERGIPHTTHDECIGVLVSASPSPVSLHQYLCIHHHKY